MNEIDLSILNPEIYPLQESLVLDFVDCILQELGIDNWGISLVFCADSFIQDLNKRFRQKDEATDVLTFAQDEGESLPLQAGELRMAGDIVISLDTWQKNCEYFKVPLAEELKRLIIHGILHLQGHDHQSNDPEEEMLKLQEEILQRSINKLII